MSDFEINLSVNLNETDIKTIKSALNRVYQQGRDDALLEIKKYINTHRYSTEDIWNYINRIRFKKYMEFKD